MNVHPPGPGLACVCVCACVCVRVVKQGTRSAASPSKPLWHLLVVSSSTSSSAEALGQDPTGKAAVPPPEDAVGLSPRGKEGGEKSPGSRVPFPTFLPPPLPPLVLAERFLSKPRRGQSRSEKDRVAARQQARMQKKRKQPLQTRIP